METGLSIALGIVGVIMIAAMVTFVRSRPDPASGDTIRLLSQRLEDLAALRAKVDGIASAQDTLRSSLTALDSAMTGVETKLVESTSSVKDSVLRDFAEARRTLEGIRVELDSRKQMDKEIRQSTRHIESVIAGGRTRGRAGENILAEAFSHFPPNIVETNFRVNGHPVEYALVLADGKRVPIDSKWTAMELIEHLESETDAAQRERLVTQIEQTVASKVKEVTKYIDPARTTPWGIAAVPDAAFSVCRNAHLNAFADRVILMPFSLAILYCLTLYQLHLQYSRSVDIEKLEGYLDQLQHGLDGLDSALENKVSRGATMIFNALGECKRQVGTMRNAAACLRTLPGGEEVQPLSLFTPSAADGDGLPGHDPPS